MLPEKERNYYIEIIELLKDIRKELKEFIDKENENE